jgi:23S rRNA (guanine1835-N2)-methyltransferase
MISEGFSSQHNRHLRQYTGIIVAQEPPRMTKTELTIKERTLSLFRFPKKEHDELQAWDAGDEYLINHVEDLNLEPNQKVLILNDHYGALACWFSEYHRIVSLTDSTLSMQGSKQNLKRNKCQEVEFLTSLDDIPSGIDLVLIQIPKNNRYLSWQLTQLRKSLRPDCIVIAVNKVKDLHSSTLKLFERYLGKTTTSLAWKKHRLVFISPNPMISDQAESHTKWQVEEENFTITNLPNVFSGESLDIGARFFLPHIPQDENVSHIIDLGCGNGVLSVKAAKLNPQARITCVDESFMAVASARENLVRNITVSETVAENRFNCITNNCLDGFDTDSCDMVLCNPPFHQQNAITDHIAWQMFCDAKHVLVTGGRLLVIGNRHLRYDVKLVRLFGKNQVKIVATNHKFVILQATRR